MTPTDVKYRQLLIKNQIAASNAMKRVFNNYVANVTKFLNDPSLRFSKSFTLRNNQLLGTILSGQDYEVLKQGAYEVMKDAVTNSWILAGQQTNEAFKGYAKLLETYAGKGAASMDVNRKALSAFIRGRSKDTLSSRVWKTTAQLRDEMAVHLGIGIANGDSAATVSRRVRQYLNQPDKLFRKVKYTGSDGVTKFRWSKRAQQYHPGRGVYRSAYMNAMRVTRTETNMAFLAAKQQAWRSQRFVLGYKVELSTDHAVQDICDELQGEYPKDFLFGGWHPNCMCHCTPILMNEFNFKKYLSGNSVREKRIGLPKNFSKWIENNADKLRMSTNLPYFMRDNIVQEGGRFSFLGKDVLAPKPSAPKPIEMNPPVLPKAPKPTQGTLNFGEAQPKPQITPKQFKELDIKVTPEDLFNTPEVQKAMDGIAETIEEKKNWWERYHAKTKNYEPDTFYRVETGTGSGYAGVGNGLYLGRDAKALKAFYDIEEAGLPVTKYTGKAKWLDLRKAEDMARFEKQLEAKGIKLTNSEKVGELVKSMGYDGIAYYDAVATGEEYVLFDTAKLTKFVKPEVPKGKMMFSDLMKHPKYNYKTYYKLSKQGYTNEEIFQYWNDGILKPPANPASPRVSPTTTPSMPSFARESTLRKHPMWNPDEYNALKNKKLTNQEILQRWETAKTQKVLKPNDLLKHQRWNPDDYKHLRSKGYTNEEIYNIWNADLKLPPENFYVRETQSFDLSSSVQERQPFMNAKSIEQANEYARDNLGAKFCDYGELDLELANQMNKLVYDYQTVFPEFKMNGMGSAQKLNKELERLILRSNKKGNIYEKFKDIKADFGNNTVAFSRRASGWIEKTPMSTHNGVYVNETKGYSWSKLMETRKRDVLSQWSPKGTESPASVIRHELGHELDKMTGYRDSKSFAKIYAEETKNGVNFVKTELSEYGATAGADAAKKPIEFIAEAWCEYTSNQIPRRLATKVGDDMMLHIYKFYIDSTGAGFKEWLPKALKNLRS